MYCDLYCVDPSTVRYYFLVSSLYFMSQSDLRYRPSSRALAHLSLAFVLCCPLDLISGFRIPACTAMITASSY